VQRLARGVTDVAELRQEVTWARAPAVIAETRAARVEEMGHEEPSDWLLLVGKRTRRLRGSSL
jgi:hypothetical protein